MGRIDDLTCFVLEHALQDLSSWGARQENLSCSVNISAQLLGDSKFVEKVIAMVESANVACEQVIFEVTETAALADPELSVLALNRIRDAGIKISIDDYGCDVGQGWHISKAVTSEVFQATWLGIESNALLKSA